MDRKELMKLSPKEAFNAVSWESIEFLFRPSDAFELLLRLNYNGTVKVLRKKLDVINQFEGDSFLLWKEATKSIAVEDYYRLLKEEKLNQEKRNNMKFKMTFKDPDGVWDSLKDAGYDPNDLPTDVDNLVGKYIEFSEYLTIEFDIENESVRVVPKGE